MDLNWQIVVLGLIQGVSEFLPVSSSAQMKLAALCVGLDSKELLSLVSVVLHVATLIVLLVYFKDRLRILCQTFLRAVLRRSTDPVHAFELKLILILSFWTALFGLFMKSIGVQTLPASQIGVFLVFNSLICFAIPHLPQGRRHFTVFHAHVLGVIQGLCTLPGISRSGGTILGGVVLGIPVSKMAEFSFFMSIPAVLGATLLECYATYGDPVWQQIPPFGLGISFGLAMLIGHLGLKVCLHFVDGKLFKFCGFYCLLSGIVLLTAFEGS